MSEADRPKIIIDDDWKAQAQAEKAKLAEQEKSRQAAAPASVPGPVAPGAPGAAGESEEVGFQDLVQMLASQALLYMGAFPDPQSGRAVVSPPMARAHIDLLGVLEEKTKGNLSEEEAKLLQGVLHEIRMQFVEMGKAIEQAIKDGRISPAQAASLNSGAGAAQASPRGGAGAP